MAIEYQVDKDGNVVRLKTVEGDDYQLFQKEMKAPPKPVRLDRWFQLKVAISKQPKGVWIEYSGFPNLKELKLAYGILNRYSRDVFFKERLNGFKIQGQTDRANLKLYVKVDEK